MAAQFYKINYKSDFVLTINSDAGWAVPFCIKFWTGMPSQAYFVGFDGEKYVNCRVGDTPTQLLVMFDDHHMPIGELKMQIAYHTTIEEFPDRKFDEVTNPTNVTVDIDGTDYQVMLDFTGETGAEIDFSMPSSGVMSVNGKIGYVTLNAEDVGAQPTIEDLATIRSGAAEGATAVQPAEMTAALATKQDTISDLTEIRRDSALGATAVRPSELQQGLATKQNVIEDLSTIRSGAAAGATAVQPSALQEGLATKQDVISDLATIRSGAAAGATAVQPAAITPIQTALQTIEAVIPSAASSQNQLADKNFVNRSIATNTANFVGTYNSLAELQAVQNPTNNDYGFVIDTDAQGNEYYDRYKYVAASQQWLFEYKVESTPFTAAQWAAIQSGITSALVTKLNALPTNAELQQALDGKADAADIPTALSQLSQDSTHRVVTDSEKSTWNGKQNAIDDLATIRSGAAAGATAVQPAAMNTALAAKQDTLTFDNTPTANSNNPVKSSGIKTALDTKQSTISTVDVTVDNNTGTPSGSASVSGSTLSLSFQNLKGATGATGATGPQGPQGERGLPGESGVTGDVSGFTVIQTIDPSATYGPTDIAGAATVQATNQELTELSGEVDNVKSIDKKRVYIRYNLRLKYGINGSTYNSRSYDYRSEVPVKPGYVYTITGHSTNAGKCMFLTQSDASVTTAGAASSITSDGKTYTIPANTEIKITAPDDARYMAVQVDSGTTSSNKVSTIPKSIYENILLNDWRIYVDDELVYDTTTTTVNLSAIVTRSYNFNSSSIYTGTSSNHHYIINVTKGCVYTVTAGSSAIYVGFLKSKTNPTVKTYADLSVYNGTVFGISANGELTLEAPEDAVALIFSAIPSGITESSSLSTKGKVSGLDAKINEHDEEFENLKVPLNILPTPSTTYRYNANTAAGTLNGTSVWRRVCLPITPGKTYRCTNKSSYSNYYGFTTSTDSDKGTHEQISLVSGTVNNAVAAGQFIELTAPEGAVYLDFNTVTIVNNVTVNLESEIGEVLTLEGYLTAEHYPETIFELNPDVEVRNKLLQMKRLKNLNQQGQGTQPLSILHCSDIHGDSVLWNRMISFMDKYNVYIDDAICTGDLVSNTFDNSKAFLANGGDKVMLVLGNHDCAKSSYNVYDTTAEECYTSFFAPYIANWGVTSEVNKCYYYKDYSTQKIRLIVLDGTTAANNTGEHWNSTQLEWLTNTLSDAKTNSYKVIIASHYWAVNSSGRTYINCAFTCKDPLSEGEAILPSSVLTAVQSFIDGGGTFICYLSGHTHRDFIYYPTEYPKQLGIVVDCAAGSGNPITVCDEARIAGTRSYDAFNIYGFDVTRKIIKIVRIGSDYDSYLRHKGTLCISYANDSTFGQVISES